MKIRASISKPFMPYFLIKVGKRGFGIAIGYSVEPDLFNKWELRHELGIKYRMPWEPEYAAVRNPLIIAWTTSSNQPTTSNKRDE